MSSRQLALSLALFATLFATPLDAEAGAFTVTPVRIYMTPRDRAVALTITNEGDSELVIQADINVWTQSTQGQDRLELTEDLILAPPIVKLAPKSRQVVRLALARPADLSRQLTYRLIMREVPEALPPKEGELRLPIALALSIPVFITPPVAKPQLQCELRRRGPQTIDTVCSNGGTAYTQVLELSLLHGDSLLGRVEPGAYILPAASKAIPVKTAADIPPGPVRIRLLLDDGKSQLLDASLP